MMSQEIKQMSLAQFQNLVAFANFSLQQATKNQNNQQLVILHELRISNPCRFYILCSQIFAQKTKPLSVRRYCVDLIQQSNQIRKKSNIHYWKKNFFDPENQHCFFKNMIKVLAMQEEIFRNFALRILLQLGYCQLLGGQNFECIAQVFLMTQSQNIILRAASIQLIKNLCEKLIQNLFTIDKETCIQKLRAIFFISKNLHTQNNPIKKDPNILLIPLNNALKDNFINFVGQFRVLLQLLSESVMLILEHYPNQILKMYLEDLAKQLQLNMNSKIPINTFGIQKLMEMFSLLLSMLTINRNVERNSIQLLQRVCFIIDLNLQKKMDLKNIISLISTTINAFDCNKIFQQKLQKYWEFILLMLNSTDNYLFIQGLRCTGDIARNYQKFFASKRQLIFNDLTSLIRNRKQYYSNENIQEFKEIVCCVFDVILNQTAQFEKQCDNITLIIDATSQIVQNWNNLPDKNCQLLEDIKVIIIDFYQLFYFKCQNQFPNDKLFGYFSSMWNFIGKTCISQPNPTLSFMRKCWFATFSGAIYNNRNKAYHDSIMQVLNSKHFQEMTRKLICQGQEFSQEIIIAKKHLDATMSKVAPKLNAKQMC